MQHALYLQLGSAHELAELIIQSEHRVQSKILDKIDGVFKTCHFVSACWGAHGL